MSYKNTLANKFMRDTNYIIIKDTDDLEDLEKQWELFKSCLTNRQQRLSDDRSIEIWNMTNQQHYEALKTELMKNLQSELDDNDTANEPVVYEPEDSEKINDDDITNFTSMSFDDFEIPDDENDITAEPVKEDSSIPLQPDAKPDININPISIYDIIKNDDKDTMADQYEIDSNINIIGRIHGYSLSEMLKSLEDQYRKWNSQNQDHMKKSDDKCREIYGMSNIDRYNQIKGLINKNLVAKTDKDVQPNISDNVKSSESLNAKKAEEPVTTATVESYGEFVSEVYRNMVIVNESDMRKVKPKRTKFNDTPYFTPAEMIDMGVHGNNNWYSPEPDNDGLVTNVRTPLWFDSYKNMCMDHIFEDYTSDWIATLDMLYSDFDQIKESGDEAKILARKQSILDLGWNPEIPFTRRNRKLAAKRISDKLAGSPMNLFINLDKEVPDDDVATEPVVEENAKKNTHQPIFLVFVEGTTPIISPIIKKVTESPFSHAAISFDASLKNIHSYNMSNLGVIKETLQDYGTDSITVMAFYAPNKIFNNMKDSVMDFYINSGKTVYDVGILFKKLFHKNERVVADKYHQVCSTFVDYVLRAGDITLDALANVPSPAELYNASKTKANKIIEVYSGPANEYDGKKVEKKMNSLLKKGIKAIDESISDLDSAESNDIYHNIDLWETGASNLIWVTGLSGSGKSTISKNIVEQYKNTQHIELDLIQKAKIKKWDTTKSEVMDSYVKFKGGMDNVFPYFNDVDNLTFKHMVTDPRIVDEFDDLFDYIMKYAEQHKNKRFVVEGVQISLYANEHNIDRIAKYPVIVKMNGPLKAEFRRETRKFKQDIKDGKRLIDTLASIARCHFRFIQGKFYVDDWEFVKDFKKAIGEATLPSGYTLRNATKDDTDYMYKCEMDSIDPKLKNDKKVIKYIQNDVVESIPYTKIIMHGNEVAGMYTARSIDSGYWYIGEIFIEPEYRGKGIGTSLIEDTLSQHDKVKLQVAPSNKRAIKLYEALGFKKESENEHMYVMVYNKNSVNEAMGFKDKCISYAMGVNDSIYDLRKHGFVIEEDEGDYKVTFEYKDHGLWTSYIDSNMEDTYWNEYIRLKDTSVHMIIKDNGKKLYVTINDFKTDPETLAICNRLCDGKFKTMKELIYSNEFYKNEIEGSYLLRESVLNEVKQFPVEFDKEGNLIIHKAKFGMLSFGDEIDDSVKLLQVYRNTNNIEGMKYELAKLWFINDAIEKKLTRRNLTDNQYKELVIHRATCLNVFKTNLEYVLKAEKGFNFAEYYNSTPFSDNSIKITNDTLKYSLRTIASVI